MNLVVANKYKDLIYSTNIEVLKELNGVFKVRDIENAFRSIFYRKIIIDATALENFPKEEVLRELVSKFDADKLILFLPPDNPPPKKFLSFLISINLYNFTDNPTGLVELTKRSNSRNDVEGFTEIPKPVVNNNQTLSDLNNNNNINNGINNNVSGRVVIGFKGITDNSYVTEIICMLKRTLEEKYKKDVLSIEINKKDFMYYNMPHMYSITPDKLDLFLQNNSNADVVLIDLNDMETESVTDIINLVNPSLYTTNKLLFHTRDAFIKLKGEKVIFVNSLLSNDDVNQFAKEAGISVYYNLPPLNDRIHNEELDKLLTKLGVVEEDNKNVRKGILDLFKN